VGNKAILKCLIRKPYFWSLNTIIVLVVLYDVLIMAQNENAKIYVECLVILSKLCTVYLLYQLNFTSLPAGKRIFDLFPEVLIALRCPFSSWTIFASS